MQYLLLLIISTFLASCVSNGIPAAYMPQKNPQPKYFLTVQGHIDPKLMKTVKITWVLDYRTTNPKCQTEINDFEGVWQDQDKYLKFTTHPDKNGYFQKKLPLDFFLPGQCKWQLNWGYYNVANLNDVTILISSQHSRDLQKKIVNHVICQQAKCKTSDGDWFNYNEELKNFTGHTFYLYVISEEKKND